MQSLSFLRSSLIGKRHMLDSDGESVPFNRTFKSWWIPWLPLRRSWDFSPLSPGLPSTWGRPEMWTTGSCQRQQGPPLPLGSKHGSYCHSVPALQLRRKKHISFLRWQMLPPIARRLWVRFLVSPGSFLWGVCNVRLRVWMVVCSYVVTCPGCLHPMTPTGMLSRPGTLSSGGSGFEWMNEYVFSKNTAYIQVFHTASVVKTGPSRLESMEILTTPRYLGLESKSVQHIPK